MAKEVQLRRREIKSHLPSKVIAGAKKTLASVYKDRSPLGLPDKTEEKNLLSALLNIETTDRDYSQRIKDFWTNFRVVVPSSGVVLNVEKVDDKPAHIEDYLIYTWACNHPLVAHSKQEMLNDRRKQFYIYDPEKEITRTNQEVKNTKLAYKEFLALSEDDTKMDMAIRLLSGEDPVKMTAEMKENRLDILLKQNPTKFLKVVTDPDLEVRAEIEVMVTKGILRKQGASYLYMDSTIGDSLAEAVSFFKNDRNSETILDLRSRLKQIV